MEKLIWEMNYYLTPSLTPIDPATKVHPLQIHWMSVRVYHISTWKCWGYMRLGPELLVLLSNIIEMIILSPDHYRCLSSSSSIPERAGAGVGCGVCFTSGVRSEILQLWRNVRLAGPRMVQFSSVQSSDNSAQQRLLPTALLTSLTSSHGQSTSTTWSLLLVLILRLKESEKFQ